VLARYVRGDGPDSVAGVLAQDAIGWLFSPDFKADEKTWAASRAVDGALRIFNPLKQVAFWSNQTRCCEGGFAFPGPPRRPGLRP